MPKININTEVFVFPIRVYYEDTDAGGVVYHANYLNFFERCRTEWLRYLGYEQDELRESHAALFVVSQININYLKPARFNQQLMVTTEVTTLSAGSIEVHQTICHEWGLDECEVLAKGDVSLVCVDSTKFRPKRIPDMIRQSLLSTENQA